MQKLLKITSISVIIAMLFPLSAGAGLDTKTVGKLTMIAILSVTAFVVKMLVRRDMKAAAELHERPGAPDRSMEFREGFDQWRVEWYEDRIYVFRNGVLQRQYQQHSKTFKEAR
jgi:hypothetical protein